MRVGINGFGRIGRLVFRALWGRSDIELVHINERAGDAATAAHLLEFDSVHGRWNKAVAASGGGLQVESQAISYTAGVPAMIGARQLISGAWLRPGVWNLEQLDPDPFMDDLNAWGLPWHILEVDQELSL